MRFGYFMAPYHAVGQSPTLAFERDLELIGHLDALGFDEAWVGEHHSGGHELIGSPEVFLAVAAERTRHIRLGTGVVSLPFHQPFHVAERIVLLDHLTRGRVMLGCGPGQLASDCQMLGIDPGETRPRLIEALEVIRALLRGETVTRDAGWFTLRGARLQLRPYSRPTIEMAVTGTVTPNGAVAAGSHGIGLLSMAATTPAGFKSLREHWQTYCEAAAQRGLAPERSQWRLVGPMHLAETREQAAAEVRHGLLAFSRYFHHVTPGGIFAGDSIEAILESNREKRIAVIGTPDDAVLRIRELAAESGGFGTFVLLGHEWAAPEATRRSLELFARYVAPSLDGQADAPRGSWEWVDSNAAGFADANVRAFGEAIERHARRAR